MLSLCNMLLAPGTATVPPLGRDSAGDTRLLFLTSEEGIKGGGDTEEAAASSGDTPGPACAARELCGEAIAVAAPACPSPP